MVAVKWTFSVEETADGQIANQVLPLGEHGEIEVTLSSVDPLSFRACYHPAEEQHFPLYESGVRSEAVKEALGFAHSMGFLGMDSTEERE